MESRQTYPCQIKLLLDNATKKGLSLDEKYGKKFVTIHSKRYEFLVDEYIPSTDPVVCFGREIVNREIILLDPKDPDLEAFYQKIIKSLPDSVTYKDRLNHTLRAIKNELEKDDKKLKAFLTEAEKAAPRFMGQAIISMAQNLKSKTGVCRHQALLGVYIIGRLMLQNLIPQGKIYFHRDLVGEKDDSHVRAIYVFPFGHNFRFINFDSMQHNEIFESTCPTTSLFESNYGKRAALYFEEKFYNFMLFSYKSSSDKPALTRQPSTGIITEPNRRTAYVKKEDLGKGSYGSVNLFVDDDKNSIKKIAIKTFRIEEKLLEYSIDETDAHIKKTVANKAKSVFSQCTNEAYFARIFSPFVYYAFTNDITIVIDGKKKKVTHSPKAYLAQPFFHGLPLYKIPHFSQTQAITIADALCKRTQIFHNFQYVLVHGDIHKGNVLASCDKQFLNEEDVRVIDHSLSAWVHTEMEVSHLNLDIKPPEYKNSTKIKYNCSIDLYCIGYTLRESFKKVSFDADIKPSFDEIITELTHREPKKRLSLDQALLKLAPLILKLKNKFIKTIETDFKSASPRVMNEHLKELYGFLRAENSKLVIPYNTDFKVPYSDFFLSINWNELITPKHPLLKPLIALMLVFLPAFEIKNIFLILEKIPEVEFTDAQKLEILNIVFQKLKSLSVADRSSWANKYLFSSKNTLLQLAIHLRQTDIIKFLITLDLKRFRDLTYLAESKEFVYKPKNPDDIIFFELLKLNFNNPSIPELKSFFENSRDLVLTTLKNLLAIESTINKKGLFLKILDSIVLPTRPINEKLIFELIKLFRINISDLPLIRFANHNNETFLVLLAQAKAWTVVGTLTDAQPKTPEEKFANADAFKLAYEDNQRPLALKLLDKSQLYHLLADSKLSASSVCETAFLRNDIEVLEKLANKAYPIVGITKPLLFDAMENPGVTVETLQWLLDQKFNPITPIDINAVFNKEKPLAVGLRVRNFQKVNALLNCHLFAHVDIEVSQYDEIAKLSDELDKQTATDQKNISPKSKSKDGPTLVASAVSTHPIVSLFKPPRATAAEDPAKKPTMHPRVH